MTPPCAHAHLRLPSPSSPHRTARRGSRSTARHRSWRPRQFVVDARGFANIILGRGIPPPPPSDKGHFHTESSEFWFILLGKIRYSIEGLPTFEADQGDIVYVPKQRWHLASFAGDGMSARLAMNGYPDLAHSFETK